jgi:hypothetical protein
MTSTIKDSIHCVVVVIKVGERFQHFYWKLKREKERGNEKEIKTM